MSAGPFYNTTSMTGADLRQAIATASDQDAAVLAIFARHGKALSPSQVWRIGCDAGRNWLLTSVRRSMSNLTDAGALSKLDDKVEGAYGRPEHRWAHLPAGMQKALAALHGPSVPMTDTERQTFNAQRQDEMARAEAKRNHTPQADLFGTPA